MSVGNVDNVTFRSPRALAVVDADALLSSVDNDCRHGWDSRLVRLASVGTVRLFASDHVYAEVYRGFAKIGRSRGVPDDVLSARWEARYLPNIRFVTVDAAAQRDSQVATATDETDVPTALLAKLLGPCAVFSGDGHLRRPGIAPADWRAVAKSAIAVATGDTVMLGTTVLALGPPTVAVEGIKWVTRKLGVSPWILGILVVAAGALLLSKRERRDALVEWFKPGVTAYLDVLPEILSAQTEGIRVLESVMIQAESRSIHHAVARIMAHTRGPLLPREIRDDLAQSEDWPGSPALPVVQACLKSNTAFVRAGRYRWQLGSTLGAAVDSVRWSY